VADYTPVYTGDQRPMTKTTSATVTGGQVLVASGVSTVAPAGAAATTVVGVAAHDAASGAKVSVWPLAGIEHEIVCATGITAAGGVQTAASGQVDPATTSIAAASAAGTLIGIATTTATATNKVRFVGRT
jgi:hypothetical protein